MYALKQDDFHLTGFDPDIGDPQKETKDLLDSLTKNDQSQLLDQNPLEFQESTQSTFQRKSGQEKDVLAPVRNALVKFLEAELENENATEGKERLTGKQLYRMAQA